MLCQGGGELLLGRLLRSRLQSPNLILTEDRRGQYVLRLRRMARKHGAARLHGVPFPREAPRKSLN